MATIMQGGSLKYSVCANFTVSLVKLLQNNLYLKLNKKQKLPK